MPPVEEITGSFDYSLSDGEVFENKLIRANGNTVSIVANSGSWTIRNVGILDAQNPNDKILNVLNRDGGNGVIDNIFVTNTNRQTNHMFVGGSHSGHLKISNSYFTGGEDILYASSPGNPQGFSGRKAVGQGGTVEVENIYGEDIDNYGVRLGSTNSVCKNATIVGASPCFANLYGNPVTFSGCNGSSSNIALRVGDHVGQNASDANVQARAVVRDSNFNGEIQTNEMAGGPAIVEGNPGTTPNTDIPAGIPLSGESAANGNSSARATQSSYSPGSVSGNAYAPVQTGPTVYEGGDSGVPPMPTGSDEYQEVTVATGNLETIPNVPVSTDIYESSRGLKPGDVVLVDYLEDDGSSPFVSDFYYNVAEEDPIAKQKDWRNRIDTAVIDMVQGQVDLPDYAQGGTGDQNDGSDNG